MRLENDFWRNVREREKEKKVAAVRKKVVESFVYLVRKFFFSFLWGIN